MFQMGFQQTFLPSRLQRNVSSFYFQHVCLPVRVGCMLNGNTFQLESAACASETSVLLVALFQVNLCFLKNQPLSPLQTRRVYQDTAKTKEKAQEVLSGRQPSKAGRKELSSLYGGTALDPKERVRKTVLKKARRFAGKRKTKRSTSSSSKGSSGSSSTSESLGLGTEGVFAEETKARAISERYPGALTVETLLNMRRSLLTTSGEEEELKDTSPVAILYFRNVLTKKASGAQARELLTLSTTIDALLKGQPALALDVLCQRLKSQELVLGGTHWAVAQKIELAAGEAPALIARGELQTAQRENYLEARARWQTQSSSAKGAPKGKTKGKFDKDHPPREDRKEDARRDKGKGGEKK